MGRLDKTKVDEPIVQLALDRRAVGNQQRHAVGWTVAHESLEPGRQEILGNGETGADTQEARCLGLQRGDPGRQLLGGT